MPADRLSRRLLLLTGTLSVLLIAVVVNYLLHGGAAKLNPVAEAAERTAALPGARIKMDVAYAIEGHPKPIVATGSGEFNALTGRGRLELSEVIPGRGPMALTTVSDERAAYTRSPALTAKLPPGKEWLGMEPFLGHDPQNALGGGPGAQGTIEMLKATGGGVEEIDHRVIRGHETTGYKGAVEMSRVADLMAEHGESELARVYETVAKQVTEPIPVEVWIDEQGLARRVGMVEKMSTSPGGPTFTMAMRIELFDFSVQPKIQLPPQGAVYDYTPILREELGL